MDDKYKKYLNKKSIQGPWAPHCYPLKENYNFIITIPCYDEYGYIFKTLNSINLQDQDILNHTLVVIAINNSNEENLKIINNNSKTYQKLISEKYDFEFVLIDAFSNQKSLDRKNAGVGMARKIACDVGLEWCHSGSIFCFLDADTILDKNYLLSIESSHEKYDWKCATVMFEHQEDEPETIRYIHQYENFLITTSKLLKKSGSPYCYIPLGSTIVCSLSAYIGVGGMNRRKAAEDFYFLQDLEKCYGVFKINSTLVYPSSRYIPRAYLGTSSRLKKCLNGELDINKLFYTQNAFTILGEWLLMALKSEKKSYSEISQACNSIDENLLGFLNEYNFQKAWEGINQAPTPHHFKKQFHRWFDSFKTFKLLKYYSYD